MPIVSYKLEKLQGYHIFKDKEGKLSVKSCANFTYFVLYDAISVILIHVSLFGRYEEIEEK